jgi:hypothetical protein
MNHQGLGCALSDKVLGTERRVAALSFEMSPAFRTVQSQAMARAVAPYQELRNRLDEMVQDIVLPAPQLATLVANPVIEEAASSLQRLSAEVTRPALATLRLPELGLPNLEAVFETGLLAQRLLAEQSALQKLTFAPPDELLRQWESLLGRLPDLDVEEGEELARWRWRCRRADPCSPSRSACCYSGRGGFSSSLPSWSRRKAEGSSISAPFWGLFTAVVSWYRPKE